MTLAYVILWRRIKISYSWISTRMSRVITHYEWTYDDRNDEFCHNLELTEYRRIPDKNHDIFWMRGSESNEIICWISWKINHESVIRDVTATDDDAQELRTCISEIEIEIYLHFMFYLSNCRVQHTTIVHKELEFTRFDLKKMHRNE